MDEVTRDEVGRELGYALRQIAYADERCTSLAGRDALERARQAITDALGMLEGGTDTEADEEEEQEADRVAEAELGGEG